MLTPTQEEAWQRHKAFRARIAEKAAQLEAKAQPAVIEEVPNSVEEIKLKIPEPWFSILEEIKDVRSQTDCPSIRTIQAAVCRRFQISRNDFLSPRRLGHLARARQISVFLCRELTRHSLPEISRRHGGRDHTTALHAIRKIAALMESQEDIRLHVNDLRKEIVP